VRYWDWLRRPGCSHLRFDVRAIQAILVGMKVYHSPLKLTVHMAMGKPVVASAVEDARASAAEQKG